MEAGDVLLGCGVRGFGFQIDFVYLRLNHLKKKSLQEILQRRAVWCGRGCRIITSKQTVSSALRSAVAQQRWIA